MDDLGLSATGHDQGLFEHQPGGHYLHLLREVLLTYRLFLRRVSEVLGVSGAQFEALRQLALAGGRTTTSALARELGVDPAAVTRLVAGLEKLGLRRSGRRTSANGRRRPVVLAAAATSSSVPCTRSCTSARPPSRLRWTRPRSRPPCRSSRPSEA